MQNTKHLIRLNKEKFIVSLKKRFPTEFYKSHQKEYLLISGVM